MPLFMPHRTPYENQQRLGFADGGVPMPSPSMVQQQPQADPHNPPPIGSSPQNVADNIPAKLSEGEFVMPADVVKFYGIDHFHKLITKAKEGMLQIAQQGLIKGNGPPVPHVPRDGEGNPQEGAPPAEGAAAGGFFAPMGHPQHGTPRANANGGYQSYAEGGYAAGGLSTSLNLPRPPSGLAAPSLHMGHAMAIPQGHGANISGSIPHNTGIVHSGVRGPLKNGTAFTHAIMSAPHVKMNDGGFLGTDYSNAYSAGGMPGGMMTPYNNPSAPMTAQPDYANQRPQQYPQTANQGMMQPYQ